MAIKANFMFQKYKFHLIAIAIFAILASAFSSPVLSGKTIRKNDIMQHRGSATEIKKYREETGRQIYWTNVIFAGMPSYMTSVIHGGEILKFVPKTINSIFLDPAIGYPFMLMLGFYILGIAFKVDPRIAIMMAFAYGFSTYFFILQEAGHNAKIHAMVYLPGILAGMIWAYRQGKIYLGLAVFSAFLALELSARHPQMFYYFLFLAIPYGIYEAVKAFQKKNLPHWLKATAFLLGGGVLALGTNYAYLKSTLDFSKNTIRGKSELTSNKENKTDGLDRDYVTNWSYGIDESWTLLIPNFKGGATGAIQNQEGALDDVDTRFRQAVGGQNSYFGNQPFTSGPVYVGAVVFLLAVIALAFYPGKLKYLLLGVFALTLMLSWGKNLNGLTNFFLDYFPAYNKFRAVASFMVIPILVLPILAMLGFKSVSGLSKEEWKQKVKLPIGGNQSRLNLLYLSGGLVVVFLLINFVAPGVFNEFLSDQEAQTLPGVLANAGFNQVQADDFMAALETARLSVFKADVGRSLGLVLAAFTALVLLAQGRAKPSTVVLSIGVLILLDLFSVNKRYINKESFVNKSQLEQNYGIQPTNADRMIMAQYAQDPYFRTLNLTVSPFNDATTSFFHYSIGGYHGAKLKIYNEIYENQLGREFDLLRTKFQQGNFLPSDFAQVPVLRMLNTKYIITNPQQPVLNPGALGNAWLVRDIKEVANADEEIAALGDFDPARTAILRSDQAAKLGGLPADAGQGTIRLTSYDPEKLTYQYNGTGENLVIFSEIWYPEHWKLTIDGEEAEILRANYVLRAAKVPAGEHEIVMEFTAAEDTAGSEWIALIASIAIIGLVPFGIWYENKQNTEAA